VSSRKSSPSFGIVSCPLSSHERKPMSTSRTGSLWRKSSANPRPAVSRRPPVLYLTARRASRRSNGIRSVWRCATQC
jgi:hypothetical protein